MAFLKKAAAEFERQNPGVSVATEVVPAAQFATKWPAAQQAQALPDVTTVLPEAAIPMQLAGALNPMDEVLDSLGGPSAFVDGLVDKLSRYGGQVISLPHYAHNRLFIYRSDLVKANGLNLPAAPTWNQAFEVAEKVQKQPEQFGWILKLAKADTGGSYLLTLLAQGAGGRLFDGSGKAMLDTPEVLRATDFLVQIANTLSTPGQTGYSIADNFNLVATGKTATTEDSAAIIGNLVPKDPTMAGHLATSFFPRDTQPAYLLGSFGLAMPKGRNPELAKKFVQFLYSEAMYVPFLQTIPLFMFPTLKAANSDAFYANSTIAKFRTTAEQTLTGIAQGSAPGFDDGPNPYAGPAYASHIVEEALQSILVSKTPTRDAMTTANKRLQDTLDDVKSRVGSR